MRMRGAIVFWTLGAALLLASCTSGGSFDEPNPLGVPDVDPRTYRLTIAGEVDNPLDLTLADLTALPAETCTVAMPLPDGSTRSAEWTGVPLADLLHRAGIRDRADRVVFRSANGMETSITAADAKTDAVFLATKVDGRPLSADLGFPMRVVADGKYWYKWARWVVEIRVIRGDHVGFWEALGHAVEGDVSKNTLPNAGS